MRLPISHCVNNWISQNTLNKVVVGRWGNDLALQTELEHHLEKAS
jgi:hypothetical protein